MLTSKDVKMPTTKTKNHVCDGVALEDVVSCVLVPIGGERGPGNTTLLHLPPNSLHNQKFLSVTLTTSP